MTFTYLYLTQTVRDPCLVSVIVNPLTNQLLALAGDGVVYTLIAPSQGECVHTH